MGLAVTTALLADSICVPIREGRSFEQGCSVGLKPLPSFPITFTKLFAMLRKQEVGFL